MSPVAQYAILGSNTHSISVLLLFLKLVTFGQTTKAASWSQVLLLRVNAGTSRSPPRKLPFPASWLLSLVPVRAGDQLALSKEEPVLIACALSWREYNCP